VTVSPDGPRQFVPVTVDVKPGAADTPSINPNSNGLTPVAILSSQSFDARAIEAESLRIGRNQIAAVKFSLEDVNADQKLDMLVHFRTHDAGLMAGDTQLCVGGTAAGRELYGCGNVRVLWNGLK
jgi:hypothetical protein